MAMDDLDEMLVTTRARSSSPSLQEARLELQRVQREHRAKYIDLYAKERTFSAGLTLHDVPMLKTLFDLDCTLMPSKNFPENLNKEWAEALGDVAHLCVGILRKAKQEGTLPAPLHHLESELVATIDVIEPIAQAQAKRGHTAQALKSIWDQLNVDSSLEGPT